MKVREKGRNRGRKVGRGGRWEGWKEEDGREEYTHGGKQNTHLVNRN